jgi:hypothetical protein
MKLSILFLISLFSLSVSQCIAAEVRQEIIVKTPAELRAALGSLVKGAVLKIGPGEYSGDHAVSGIEGLTVEALDAAKPPVFRGGNTAWQFSRCVNLTARNLVAVGQKGNGFNFDDGSVREKPVTGVTLEGLAVREIGPSGNHDGIKISGLDQLTIRNCKIEGWGGQGIDLVGCHRVTISGCELKGKDGFSATAGIQMKGGCSEIIVEKCHFIRAGERAINLGGSTGMPYFRPVDAKFEAKIITVRENIIEGSLCAAAFVGLDGGEFSGNTILYPEKWIFRILQETKTEGFPPCRNVVIKRNRILFRRAQVATDINFGPNTAPETFTFAENHWFAEDRPAASKPKLPVEETGGKYGTDPRK